MVEVSSFYLLSVVEYCENIFLRSKLYFTEFYFDRITGQSSWILTKVFMPKGLYVIFLQLTDFVCVVFIVYS